MDANKDYWNGILLLKKECKKLNINIRKYGWVIPFSLCLSKFGVCEKVWKYAIKYGNLSRIPNMETINDVFHNNSTMLFHWDSTREGFDFWSNIDDKIFYKNNIKTISLNNFFDYV